jgi:hypothetical protein
MFVNFCLCLLVIFISVILVGNVVAYVCRAGILMLNHIVDQSSDFGQCLELEKL